MSKIQDYQVDAQYNILEDKQEENGTLRPET